MLLSAGVIMSVILISIMVTQFEKAKDLSGTVSRKLLSDTEMIAQSDILQYDGMTVTGADVKNFYRRYITASDPEVLMLSIDNGRTRINYDSPGHIAEMSDPSGYAYISPADTYVGSVVENKNGIITGVVFTKK